MTTSHNYHDEDTELLDAKGDLVTATACFRMGDDEEDEPTLTGGLVEGLPVSADSFRALVGDTVLARMAQRAVSQVFNGGY